MRAVNGLLEKDPRNPGYNNLKAAILARIGELKDSIEIYAGVLAEYPGAAQDLDELWACARNQRPRARQHRCLQKEHRIAAQHG